MTHVEQQRMDALELANLVRVDRARVKRDLFTRTITFREALDHESVQGMKLYDLLRVQQGWGRTKTGKASRALLISPERRVEDLTAHQRLMVLRYLCNSCTLKAHKWIYRCGERVCAQCDEVERFP